MYPSWLLHLIRLLSRLFFSTTSWSKNKQCVVFSPVFPSSDLSCMHTAFFCPVHYSCLQAVPSFFFSFLPWKLFPGSTSQSVSHKGMWWCKLRLDLESLGSNNWHGLEMVDDKNSTSKYLFCCKVIVFKARRIGFVHCNTQSRNFNAFTDISLLGECTSLSFRVFSGITRSLSSPAASLSFFFLCGRDYHHLFKENFSPTLFLSKLLCSFFPPAVLS